MTKVQIIHLIDGVLRHVPVPVIPQAAAGIDALIDALAPADVAQWKDALAAAQEPWARIHERASAAELGQPHGSIGE